MAIYLCRICGNPMDPISSDGICDDCYFGQSSFLPLKNDKKSRASSRSASSGNKKKSKIQKAAALIMAMMIALSSLCLSAFAEDTTDITFVSSFDGKYLDKYDTIAFDKNELISFDTLHTIYDSYLQADETINVLYVYLIGFDSSGAPHSYSTKSDLTFLSCSYISSGVFSVTGPYLDFGTNWFPYDYVTFGYSDTTAFHFYKETSDLAPEKYNYYFTYTDGRNEFTSLCSDNMYLVFVPFNSKSLDYRTILPSLLSGSPSDLTYSDIEYSAKFHSFASMNDNVGGLQGILNMIDWIGMGNQYPTCDFSINDNGNHHSYSLRISTNKNYVDICMSLWEDYRLNKIVQTGSTAIALAFTPDIISKFVLASTNGAIDVFGIRNNVDNMADAVRFAAQVKFLESIEDLSYVTEYNLTNQHMRFNEGESSSRAYSVCLADYVSIVKGLVYKLEIIDNNTGIVLDKAYFCNDTTFQKTNTGYGTKVYNYDDYNDLLDDIDKDNDYGSSSGTIESDKLQTDNNNDIIVNFDPTQLDLGSYMDSLNGIVSNVSSFFTWVWALFPPEIMTIIIMGVGLLITCGLVKFFVG